MIRPAGTTILNLPSSIRSRSLWTATIVVLATCAYLTPRTTVATPLPTGKWISAEGAGITLDVATRSPVVTTTQGPAVRIVARTQTPLDDVVSPPGTFVSPQTQLTGTTRIVAQIFDPDQTMTWCAGTPVVLGLMGSELWGEPTWVGIHGAAFFGHYSAGPGWKVFPYFQPVWVADSDTNLRFWSTIQAPPGTTTVTATLSDGQPLTVSPESPESSESQGTYRIEWTGPQVWTAMSTGNSTVFSATGPNGVSTLTITVDARVVATQITVNDPSTEWPEPTCTEEVSQCIEMATDDPTIACVPYMTAMACKMTDPCESFEVEPTPLIPMTTESLAGAITNYNAQCSKGGTWCGLYQVKAWRLPECAKTPTLVTLVEWLSSVDQEFSTAEMLQWGTQHTDEELGDHPFFAPTYSNGGPTLLTAIDNMANSNTAEGWSLAWPVPCPNCTDFSTKMIVFYPQTGVVVELWGHYGYDS